MPIRTASLLSSDKLLTYHGGWFRKFHPVFTRRQYSLRDNRIVCMRGCPMNQPGQSSQFRSPRFAFVFILLIVLPFAFSPAGRTAYSPAERGSKSARSNLPVETSL